jgi:Mannosyltransferase (PIG-V)
VKLPKWAVALDALAILAALLAISVVVFGGFRIWMFGARLSVMDATRPAMLSLLALVIRHVALRRNPLPQHVASSVVAWWRRPDTRLLLPIHVSTRAGVIVVGFLAVILIGYPPEAMSTRWSLYPDNAFLDLPARWDTGWYLGVATEGYQYNPDARRDYQQNIAFFPAFPMLMRFFSPVLGRQPLWTGVAISLVSFFLALGYLLRLARMELGDDDSAITAVTLLATYPFAVFYSVAYTEALFLLTITGAVYHFRREQLVRSACWGIVAGLTRPNGCFLSIVLGLMAIAPLWEAKRSLPALPPAIGWPRLSARIVAAAAPGIGMLIFSAYIYTLTGNAFQWTAQNAAWGREYRGLDNLVIDRVGFIATNGLYAYASTQTIDFFYLTAVLFVLGSTWPVYKRFGLPYAVMLLINVLPPLAAGGLLSMGRVTSVLFPAFLWMGGALPAQHRTAWIAFFACLQGFVAAMFFTWRPLY